MSKDAVVKVVQRAISDGAFRRQLSNDPTGALRGFDLTPAETAAIRSGDSGRLTAFGVDVRMSKAFNLGGNEGGSSVVSNAVSSDLGASGSGSFNSSLTSADGASASGALLSGTAAAGSSVLTSGGGSLSDNALVSGDTSDADPMISSGNELGRAGVIIPGDPAHAYGVLTGSDGGTALPDEADQYSPQFHSTLTSGETQAPSVVTGSDGGTALPADADQYNPQFNSGLTGEGGSSMPGEPGDGPEIQP
jgi:hypothetical protein